MDHTDVIERGLVEGYHRGLLTPEEEAEFEAHFFACPRCTQDLELARGFERGLKTLVAEDLQRAALARAGLFAWLARRGALARWGLPLAALALAAGLPLLGWLREQRALRSAEAASADLRARASGLEERLVAAERKGKETRRALEERLAAREPALEPSAGGPLVNTPVFLLALVRGAPVSSGPTIDPARTGSHFSLALDVDDAPGVADYLVTVRDAAGKERFRQSGLKRNSLETLLLTFPSSYFAPGEYRLKVTGVPAQGLPLALGEYRFRIVASRSTP